MNEFKLCYVRENFAFFTTAKIEDQIGDDWNDRPYEHNAGAPYEYDKRKKCEPYEIKKISYECELIEPSYSHCNSPWSVKDINAGQIAWLRSPSWSDNKIAIHAGTTLDEFVRIIEEDGGVIYLPNKTKTIGDKNE